MSASAHHKTTPEQRSKFGVVPSEEPIGVPMNGGLYISEEQLSRIDRDPGKARKYLRMLLAEAKEPKIINGPTLKPDGVRIAGPHDEEAVFALALMDLKENAVAVAPINDDKVREMVHIGVCRMEGTLVGVIDGPDGKPVAFQILRPETWWWSKGCYLCKVVDFVHPDHRKTDYALRLIQFAKWASDFFTKTSGYQMYLLSGVLATVETRGKVRLYSRHLTPIGAYFLYPRPAAIDDPIFPLRET